MMESRRNYLRLPVLPLVGALDLGKLLVFALLAAGVVLLSGPTSNVQAADFTSATETKLNALDAETFHSFGDGVAIDGDTAVAGAPRDDDGGTDSGAVYVFTRDASGNWSQQAKLTALDPAADDFFGFRSVAVSGDTVVVGASADDDYNLTGCGNFTSCNSGSAYVFVRPAAGWSDATEDAKLTASDAEKFDNFGVSVSVSGDTVVVGAWQDNAGCPGTQESCNSGSAYVFVRPVGGWTGSLNEQARLMASDAAFEDVFGNGVSVSGDTVVVGASRDDDGGLGSGSAYVFVEPAGGWSGVLNQQAKLTASDAAASDFFGAFVSVDGGTVVVGSFLDDDGGSGSGSAYVFERPGAGWSDATEDAKLTASDAAINDQFGFSVSVNGDTVAVGARGDDDGGSGSGSAYVFERPGAGWSDATEDTKLTASDASADDGFSGGFVSVSGDTLVIGSPGDDDGGTNSGSAYVYVAAPSNQPPDCSSAAPSSPSLWPPNHKFVPINVTGVTDPDTGDTVTINIDSIFQDEPVSGKGSGKTTPDGQVVDSSTAEVRAERSGKGNGRVYEIGYTADDGNGGTCSGTVAVGVPHDKKGTAVNDNATTTYDSTAP